MIMPLLKTVIFSCFAVGFTGVTLAQTYDEKILNQNIQLRVDKINQETDSLATILAALKIDLEKLNSEDAKKIRDFKITEKYDSIIRLQFTFDSILSSKKQQIKFLDVLSDRDNLLDSILIGRKVQIKAPANIYSSGKLEFEITKIKDDIGYKSLSSKGFEIKSEAPYLIRESIYQGFLSEYNRNLIQAEIQFKTFQTEQLFSFNPADRDSKRNIALRKSISHKYFGRSNVVIIVSFDTYSKWLKNGGRAFAYSKSEDNAQKRMKQGKFVALVFKSAIIVPSVNLDTKGDIKHVVTFFDYLYNMMEVGERILNEKQLSKIQAELRDNPSVKLYDQAEATLFWEDYLKQINLIKRHLAAKDETLNLQSEIQSLTEQKRQVDLLVKNLDKSLKDLENKLSGPTKSLKSKIDDITRTVDSKDRRIEKAKEEEKRRLTYIVNGDAYLKNNDFEAAISSYKNAQTIRQSSDLIEKIQLAEKKYAPILAKKQEEERKKRKEIEANRYKEYEDWHSEEILKNWLLAAPFYNYEKTVKLEFKEEYEEDFNIGWMIWVYVNGKKEGELVEYKLRGSPHNTFISIKWMRTGRTDSVIHIISSSEKVKKSKRGQMTGINAIKNGSNLRREGVSWD